MREDLITYLVKIVDIFGRMRLDDGGSAVVPVRFELSLERFEFVKASTRPYREGTRWLAVETRNISTTHCGNGSTQGLSRPIVGTTKTFTADV